MRNLGTRIFFVGLVVLLVLFVVSKPDGEWIKAQLDAMNNVKEAGEELKDAIEKNESEKPSSNSNEKVATDPNKKVVSVMYQWIDKTGNVQFTESPPADRPFKKIKMETKQGLNNTRSQVSTSQINSTSRASQSRVASNEKEVQDLTDNLSLACKSKLSNIERYEKKLDKTSDLVGSIWLADYCSALSEFIQDSCVLPKKQIKYNAYCPVRFKR